MQPSESLPRCPRCIDGGIVRLTRVANEDESIFQPLPKSEIELAFAYQCAECGWTTPASPESTVRRMPGPLPADTRPSAGPSHD